MAPRAARFPFYLPVRCPIDNGQIEMLGADKVRCEGCGASGEKIARELERLRALASPEQSDILKAARALHGRSTFKATDYDQLSASIRNDFVAQVKMVVRTLKKGNS